MSATEIGGVDQARATGRELCYECIVACPSTRRLQWRKHWKVRGGGESGDVCASGCINCNVLTNLGRFTSDISGVNQRSTSRVYLRHKHIVRESCILRFEGVYKRKVLRAGAAANVSIAVCVHGDCAA